jgi:hypothetical protein
MAAATAAQAPRGSDVASDVLDVPDAVALAPVLEAEPDVDTFEEVVTFGSVYARRYC